MRFMLAPIVLSGLVLTTDVVKTADAFALPSAIKARTTTVALHDNKLRQDIEQRSLQNAKGGMGETAAGAVLGGLLLGPFGTSRDNRFQYSVFYSHYTTVFMHASHTSSHFFFFIQLATGALFGASVGSNLGAKNSVERARQDEMDRLGITQEMLDAAQDIGLALERSMDGLNASKDSLGTLQRLARKLDADAEQVYDKAKAALAENNEEQAKEYLLQRTTIQDKLKNVLLQCAEEKKRYEKMESNVSALEERAMEVNSLLKRAVGAKTIAEADAMGLTLQSEDPLLQKFRDAGID